MNTVTARCQCCGRFSGNCPLLLPVEAAALLRVATKTLARRAREGKVAAILTPGGTHRYYQCGIEEFLRQARAKV